MGKKVKKRKYYKSPKMDKMLHIIKTNIVFVGCFFVKCVSVSTHSWRPTLSATNSVQLPHHPIPLSCQKRGIQEEKEMALPMVT